MGLILEAPKLVRVEFESDDGGPLLGGGPADSPSLGDDGRTDGIAIGYVEPPRPRLSLGADVTPIGPGSAISADVAEEVRTQEATYRFSLLRVCATIEYDADVDVDEVNVGVALEPEGYAATPPATWSMDPTQLVKPYKSPLSVEAGIEVSLLAGVKLSTRYEPDEKDQWWLQATGSFLGTSPRWVMRRRQNVDLSGDHDLKMVVRHPVGTQCVARLAITGQLRKGPLTWWRQADLPAYLRTFVLRGD